MPRLTVSTPAFVDSAPVEVTVGRTVLASPEAIWAVLTNNDGWPEWFPGMKRCETTSTTPDGLGSTRVVKVGGLVAEEEFIFWDRPKDWGFTVTKTNLPLATEMIERVRLDASEHEGSNNTITEVRYSAHLTPHPLARPITGIVKMNIRKAWEKGLVGLAAQVER